MTQYPEPFDDEPTNKEQLFALGLLALGAATGGVPLAVPVWYAVRGMVYLLSFGFPELERAEIGFSSVWLYTSLAGFVFTGWILLGIQRSKRNR
jgi:hypothetical protein